MHNFFCPEFPAHIYYLILHYQFQVGGKHGVTVGWSTIRADRAAPKLLPQTSLRTNLSLHCEKFCARAGHADQLAGRKKLSPRHFFDTDPCTQRFSSQTLQHTDPLHGGPFNTKVVDDKAFTQRSLPPRPLAQTDVDQDAARRPLYTNACTALTHTLCLRAQGPRLSQHTDPLADRLNLNLQHRPLYAQMLCAQTFLLQSIAFTQKRL